MMAGWLLYTLLTSALLVAGGYALEQIARALRAPARAVWLSVIMTAAMLSVASLRNRATPSVARLPIASAGGASLHEITPEASERRIVGASGTSPHRQDRLGDPLNEGVTRLREIAVLRLEQSRWEKYDALIAALCASLAVAGLLVLFASYVRLRRKCRTFIPSQIDGVPVLLSRHLGPAVFGILAPRVVVPRWLLALAPTERSTILLHERQHSAARDPMLVLAGAVAVALQPWNPLFWVAFARLRLAVEADCDARVLRRCSGDARWYGALLLRVCEHESTTEPASRLPLTAFVDSTSHLERRVRRMTSQPQVRSLSTVVAFVAAVVCAGVAFSVRIATAHDSAAKAGAAATSVFERAVAAAKQSADASTTADSEPTFTTLRYTPLPALVNSQHEQPRLAGSVVIPVSHPREVLAAPARLDTLKEFFSPETVLVRASNSLWPIHARIVSTGAGGMSYVTVTDTLGHVLPTADSLDVSGPVRLILPHAPFRISVESLNGDIYVRTSVVSARDGSRWFNEMLGRSLSFSRKATGASVEIQYNGKGTVRGQRVY